MCDNTEKAKTKVKRKKQLTLNPVCDQSLNFFLPLQPFIHARPDFPPAMNARSFHACVSFRAWLLTHDSERCVWFWHLAKGKDRGREERVLAATSGWEKDRGKKRKANKIPASSLNPCNKNTNLAYPPVLASPERPLLARGLNVHSEKGNQMREVPRNVIYIRNIPCLLGLV